MNSRIRLLCAQLMNAAHDMSKATDVERLSDEAIRACVVLNDLATEVDRLREDGRQAQEDTTGAPHVTEG